MLRPGRLPCIVAGGAVLVSGCVNPGPPIGLRSFNSSKSWGKVEEKCQQGRYGWRLISDIWVIGECD